MSNLSAVYSLAFAHQKTRRPYRPSGARVRRGAYPGPLIDIVPRRDGWMVSAPVLFFSITCALASVTALLFDRGLLDAHGSHAVSVLAQR